MRKALSSTWGRLFENWESIKATEKGYENVGERPAGLVRGTWRLFGLSLKILWTCIKEAPEIAVRRRKKVPG